MTDDMLDKESFIASEIISDNLIQEKVEVMRNPVNLSIVTGSKFPGVTTSGHKTPSKSVTPAQNVTPGKSATPTMSNNSKKSKERTMFESPPSSASPQQKRLDLALQNTSKTNSFIDHEEEKDVIAELGEVPVVQEIKANLVQP